MKFTYKLWILCGLICWVIAPLKSQNKSPLSDEAVVSLLIQSPGNEAYSAFGHAALRIKDPRNGYDIVANYGIFDFDTPHFIYRFVKGETDYQLGLSTFERTIWGMQQENRNLDELVLDLTPEECTDLCKAILENYRPENRVYRYNFIYDNCATRLRDVLEENIVSEIDYHYLEDGKSFRELIHEYVPANTWLGVGIDFLIGSDADIPQSPRFYSFLPDYLCGEMETARRVDQTRNTLLVKEKKCIVEKAVDDSSEAKALLSPMAWAVLGCIVLILISMWEWYRNIKLKWIDVLYCLIFGLCGMLLVFMNFVSVHPLVSPNYLLLFINPIYLLAIPLFLKQSWQKYLNYFCITHLLCSGLFIFAWFFLPQQMNGVIGAFIAMGILRSLQTYGQVKRNIKVKK